jgi:acyl-CoA oxidase
MLGTLVGGRISVANAAVSASKVALAVAVRYSHRRRQFGPEGGPELTIADYASHRRRLMPPLAATVALDLAMEHLTARYEAQALSDDDDRRQLEADVAGFKAVTTWHATSVIQACREACGGAGYLAVNRFADLKADSDVFATFEGDNTVLLQLVAKGLLTGFRAQFTEQRMLGVARFVASQAERALHRANPFEHRTTARHHLRDASLQRSLLAYRTQDQVQQVAGALRSAMSDMPPEEAFNSVQNRALAMAVCHVEEQVLNAIVTVEQAETDGAVAAVLGRLRSLYALHRIEADLGWFLQHGYMARAQATAVREEVEALCAEVADDAWHIVEAFRLPSSAMSAPIAQG